MGLDVRSLNGFRQDMTVEELVELLASDELTVSRDEYERVVKKCDSHAKEAGEYRKQLNSFKSEEELTKQQNEEALHASQERIAELEKQLSIIENEKRFVSMGYDEALAHKSAIALADGDMKSLFKYQATFNESIEKKYKEQQLKDTPLPTQEDTHEDVMTKEKLSKMSLKEQAEYAENNPESYNKLYGKGE
ncbi:MAG: hypothetical protein HFF36_02545 [Coprobacillus sp.]|nr:hypothetical protein [Coprobacillus sp.]